MSVRLGFVGFGEAGSHIAKGLADAGLAGIVAYDIHASTPGRGDKIREQAAWAETRLVSSNAELAASADILLSTVTANSAEDAAAQNAPHLTPNHFYADLNSVSPGTKQRIGDIIMIGAAARFVEAAVMAPVPPYLHKAPMLINGPHAPAFADALVPYGMKFQVIDDKPGVAAATKMCRSVIVKGIESLVMESMLASTYYGADERVWASLNETFPGMDWKKLADYVVGRVAVHGERRAREMEEVAVTLTEAGVDPTMTRAIVERMDWSAHQGMREKWGAEGPKSYVEVANFVREQNVVGRP